MSTPEVTKNPYGWGPRKILLSALAGIAVTIGVSWLPWWLLDRPLEELPGWFESGATLVGVGAAIVAGFYAARAFLIEQRRERRWDDAQLSAQASLVAAWWGEGPELKRPEPGTVHAAAWGLMGTPEGIWLRNASEVPVTDVDVVVRRPDLRMEIDWINLGVLGPSREPRFQRTTKSAAGLYRALPHGMIPDVLVFFTDSSGNRWTRTTNGALEPSDRVGPRTTSAPTDESAQR